MNLYKKSLIGRTLYVVFCSMLVLSINAAVFAEAIEVVNADSDGKNSAEQLQKFQTQKEAYRQELSTSITAIHNELTDILECYRQITEDLGIDTVAGIGQSLDLAINALSFFDNKFGIIEAIFGGFDFEVGDDTVTIGGIPVIKDIIKNIEGQIATWGSVACEVSIAVTNTCDQRNPVDSFPNAQYGCLRECRMPFELTRIWVNLVALGRLVENTVDKGAKQTIVAVGGGNVSLITAPISVVVAFARLVADNVQACDDNIQGSEIAASYLRLAALRGDHIYSDSVFNEYMIFDLRTRIEINLGGHGNHPHPIAVFQLPAIHGGFLELAGAITKETILNMILAGESIGNAENFYQKAEQEYGAGNYKVAYANYGHAYRAATRPTGESGH